MPFIDVDGIKALETVFNRNSSMAKKNEDYSYLVVFVFSNQFEKTLHNSDFYAKLVKKGLAFTDLQEAIDTLNAMSTDAPTAEENEGGSSTVDNEWEPVDDEFHRA